jgi:hypothetical protein
MKNVDVRILRGDLDRAEEQKCCERSPHAISQSQQA